MSGGSARRRISLGLICGLSVVMLSLAGGAVASSTSNVVSPKGSVAGRPYSYWLERVWKFYYDANAPGPAHCETVKLGGKTVTLVEDIRGGNITCHVPAGQPIYVNELSRGCSSIPGQHNGYGTSDYDLQKCSRQFDHTALISAWLDGQRLANFGRHWWAQAPAFSISAAPGRFKGFHGSARASAWGWSLLLKQLPKGTHTVRCKARYPSFGSHVTLRVA